MMAMIQEMVRPGELNHSAQKRTGPLGGTIAMEVDCQLSFARTEQAWARPIGENAGQYEGCHQPI